MDKNQILGTAGIFFALFAYLAWPLSEEDQAKKDHNIAMAPYRNCMSVLNLTADYALTVGLRKRDEEEVLSKTASIRGASIEMKKDVTRLAFHLQRTSLSSTEIYSRLSDRAYAHCQSFKPLGAFNN